MKNWFLWLGGVFNESTMLESSAVSPAANRWQEGLLQGIIDQSYPVHLLSYLPEPLWPRGKYRPGSYDDLNPCFNSRLITYWNMPFLRSHSLCQGHLAAFREVCEKKGKPRVVLSYNPTPHAVEVGLEAQKNYQIPWIDICADHFHPGPDWLQYSSGASLAAGHVFLSYQAFQECPFPKKFHLDGGVSQIRFNPEIKPYKEPKNKKIVLYSGMMSVWGGVSFLLKAFEKIQDPNIELWICGHGSNSDIKAILKRDSRIRFFGLVSESRLQEIYKQASVLVNPRPSKVPGNTMNFPSKILEYLSYGKPIISTWTSGLSPEYRDVLEILKEETEDCLARTIDNVLHWPDFKIECNSNRIYLFLLKKKTWVHQAKKLIEWLEDEILWIK